MAAEQSVRPQFYEGQYLNASDLSVALDYTRHQQSRHLLGGHSWGIGVGLELSQQSNLDGQVDVVLNPGYAVDGFGRTIVVDQPQIIPKSIFTDLSASLGAGDTELRVQVGMVYVESEFSNPSFGFGGCDNANENSRIEEDFRFVVDEGQFRSRVNISGTDLEPIGALSPNVRAGNPFEEDDPLLCDESVPFQNFPTSPRNWLIPLGIVKWNPTSSSFGATDSEQDQRINRAYRRYLGVVGETIHAADGVIRLRNRIENFVAGESAKTTCERHKIDESSDKDMIFDSEGDLYFKDLVWVEGNLRVVGDARIFGGSLDFLTSFGLDEDVRMEMRRGEQSNALLGKDLEIAIGESDDGINRIVFGSQKDDVFTERLHISDDGWMSHLNIEAESGDLAFELGDPDKTTKWKIRLKTDGGNDGLNFVDASDDSSKLFLMEGQGVGIGSDDPEGDLQVGDSSAAVTMRLRGPDLDDESSTLAFEDTQGSVQRWFRLTHNTNANQLTFSSFDRPNILAMNRTTGRVGINTDAPQQQLDVRGEIAFGPTGNEFAIGGIESGMRLMAGEVTNQGAVAKGTGFTVNKDPAIDGEYEVVFDESFNGEPIVVVSTIFPAGNDNMALTHQVTSGSFSVRTADLQDIANNNEGVLQNTAFAFIVVGHR